MKKSFLTSKAMYLSVSILFSLILIPTAFASDNEQDPVRWRFLLYLNADNNLDVTTGGGKEKVNIVEDDLGEIERGVADSPDALDVYVLVDREDDVANLKKINAFGVLEDMTDGNTLNSMEINMGDPAVLEEFLRVATEDSPNANRTILIFWNHGFFNYVSSDDHAYLSANGWRWDSLKHKEAVSALQNYPVDIAAADECLVGQIEPMYEYRDVADYYIAAQTYIGWRGIPYEMVLNELVNNPGMEARDVAEMIIDEKSDLLSQHPHKYDGTNTHSAVDLKALSALTLEIQDVTNLLKADIKRYAGLISKSRGKAQFGNATGPLDQIDVQAFFQRMSDVAYKNGDSHIGLACDEVLERLDGTDGKDGGVVVAVQRNNNLENKLFGLGLIFPKHSQELEYYYPEFDFAAEDDPEGWLSFVEAFWYANGN